MATLILILLCASILVLFVFHGSLNYHRGYDDGLTHTETERGRHERGEWT